MQESLSGALDRDKEQLLQRMGDAPSPEEAKKAVEEELTRLSYIAAQNAGSEEKAAYTASLFAAAAPAASFLSCSGAPKIYERKTGEEKAKGKAASAVLLIAGIALGAVVLVMLLLKGAGLVSLVLLAAALVLLYLAGRLGGRKALAKTEQKVVLSCDPEEVYSVLRAQVLVIEREIDAFPEQREKKAASSLPVDSAMLDLYGKLLEADLGKDGEYALESAGQLPFLLHREGLEVVSYTGDNDAFFELMPGEKTRTVRPAIVKDGEVLQKGLAVRV